MERRVLGWTNKQKVGMIKGAERMARSGRALGGRRGGCMQKVLAV